MSKKKNEWPRGVIQPGYPKYCIKIPQNKERNNRRLYKTELCDRFEEFGECKYGPNCQFAHGEDELKKKPKIVQPSAFKTVLCDNYWGEGFCPYGIKCRFVHEKAIGFNENKANETKAHKNYRTVECKMFNKSGTCPFGNKCAFIHKTKTPDEKTPNLKRSISDQENTLMLLENFGLTTDEQKEKDFSVDQLATMNLVETKTGDTEERKSRFLHLFNK